MFVYGLTFIYNSYHPPYLCFGSVLQESENVEQFNINIASESKGNEEEPNIEKTPSSSNELLLEIPRIRIKIIAKRGSSSKILRNNGWIRPNSALNVLEGNTIIASHRLDPTQLLSKQFTYLPRVSVGENIFLSDDLYTYHFVADTVTIVNASAGWVEAETLYPRLTLYTCTPLWSSSKRLVVTAILSDYYSKK